jgi:hypothetical protein
VTGRLISHLYIALRNLPPVSCQFGREQKATAQTTCTALLLIEKQIRGQEGASERLRGELSAPIRATIAAIAACVSRLRISVVRKSVGHNYDTHTDATTGSRKVMASEAASVGGLATFLIGQNFFFEFELLCKSLVRAGTGDS